MRSFLLTLLLTLSCTAQAETRIDEMSTTFRLVGPNDKVVVDYTEPEGVTGTRKLSEGSMALQSHDPKSIVHYKNIMIKPLP